MEILLASGVVTCTLIHRPGGAKRIAVLLTLFLLCFEIFILKYITYCRVEQIYGPYCSTGEV